MKCLASIIEALCFSSKIFSSETLPCKLATYLHLYRINAGYALNCIFCDFSLETTKYVIWNCCKSEYCWKEPWASPLVTIHICDLEVSSSSLSNYNSLFGFPCGSSV